jgi:hypothetical protein
MSVRLGRALLAVAAFIGSVVACRQLVGIGDEPPTATGGAPDAGTEAGPPCGVAYAGTACEACLEAQCCAQATACAGSLGCTGLEGCLGACNGDVTCGARCKFEHPVADPGLEACLFGSCAQPCALGCGSVAEFFGPDAAAGCANCIVNGPCAAASACLADPDCLAIPSCIGTSQAVDRNQACLGAYDAGVDAFNNIVAGLRSSCLDQCALGNQWYCVGNAKPHVQTNSATEMTVFLYDLNGAPLAGVTVDVCSEGLQPCDSLSSGTTNDAGLVPLQVPGPPPSSTYGPKGYLQLQAPAIGIDALFYWTYPLSEPAVRTNSSAPSQSEISEIAGLLGVAPDMMRGSVAFAVADCDLLASPGVQVTITPNDPETKVFYLSSNGLPIPGATSTDVSGFGGALNVPAGEITIMATPMSLGRPSTVLQAYVAPNKITLVALPPNQ